MSQVITRTVEKHMAEKHKADQDDSRNSLLLCHKGKLFSNCKKFVTSLKRILNVFPAGTIWQWQKSSIACFLWPSHIFPTKNFQNSLAIFTSILKSFPSLIDLHIFNSISVRNLCITLTSACILVINFTFSDFFFQSMFH